MESPYFDFSSPRRRQIIADWINCNERYFKLLAILAAGTLAAWYLYPILDDVEYNLVLVLKLPFDYQTPGRYGITYLIAMLCFHYTSCFVVVNDVIMQAYLMHLLCQFVVLGDCFENILVDCSVDIEGLDPNALHTNEAFKQRYTKRLGDLVKQHQFILSNGTELRRILSTPMLAQMATSGILICFAAFGVITSAGAGLTKLLMSLMYLAYNLLVLFIICRWCDEIKVQSQHLNVAVYFSGWERMAMVPGVRARLMIVVARANWPLVLTAGGIYDLSLHSYATSAWVAATAPALEQSTGKLETAFFETVYRTTYALGLSFSDNLTILYYIYSNTVKLIIVLFIVAEFWYLFSISSTLDAIIDNITVTVIHLISLYRYKSMMDWKVVYKKLATSLDSPYFDVSTAGRRKILDYWLKMQHRYFWFLLILSSSTLAFWYIHPLTDDIEYNYPAAVRFPYESVVTTTDRYIIAYTVVLFMFNYISYFVVVNDLIMQAQLIPLVCQFAVLCDCFENIIIDCSKGFSGMNDKQLFANEKFQEIYFTRLRKLVEQHKIILAYTQDLRQALSAPMLGQLMASGILICLAGYQLTAALNKSIVRTMMNLLYLTYNMLMFYLLCNWCDDIKMQSQRVGDSVYLSGWERGVAVVPGVRARLMIIVARANKPLVLSAGGIYDVSLMSYTTLVKTSYSALTVLLRFRQRDTS